MDRQALLKSVPEGEERLLFAKALDQAIFAMKRRRACRSRISCIGQMCKISGTAAGTSGAGDYAFRRNGGLRAADDGLFYRTACGREIPD